jgi:hypothetical protein
VTTSHFDHSADPHAGDGVLLALHDGERSTELDARRHHVEQCAECQARLATIVAQANHVRQSLSSFPVPPVDTDALRRRIAAGRKPSVVPLWRRPTVRAAAAVIVLAVVAAASSVRHWIVRVARPTPAVSPRSPSVPAAAPRDLTGATVSFLVSGPEFTVRLDSLPTAGVLVVDRTTGDEVSAHVASGAGTGGDAMLVLPGELRLRNAAASRASYSIAVPNAVTRLRVVVAGHVVFEGAPPVEVKLTR